MKAPDAERVLVAEGLGKVYPACASLAGAARALLRRPPPADAKVALAGVDFRLERGSALGVVGRNGSGKTTLLRLLAGVLEPSTGSVAVRGRIAALLDLGAGIDLDFTGRENASFLGVLAGASRREMVQRVESIRSFSGLGSAFDEPVRNYSSGMLLRLGFSAAIHADPGVLLIDEVLAVGDAFFQQRCLLRIQQLRESGCGIVLVTHDPSAVLRFCDRALWLEHGRIARAGEPGAVLREYLGAQYGDGVDLEASPRAAAAPPAGEGAGDVRPAAGIPNVDHRYGDGRARIEGLALRDAGGRALASPLPGQELRLTITARSWARLPTPIVGFTLRNRLGEILTASNSDYEGVALPALNPGERISVEFALKWPPFASGSFSISPAIADGDLVRHAMSDWIDNALVVEAANAAVRYGWLKLEGVGVRWSLERAAG